MCARVVLWATGRRRPWDTLTTSVGDLAEGGVAEGRGLCVTLSSVCTTQPPTPGLLPCLGKRRRFSQGVHKTRMWLVNGLCHACTISQAPSRCRSQTWSMKAPPPTPMQRPACGSHCWRRRREPKPAPAPAPATGKWAKLSSSVGEVEMRRQHGHQRKGSRGSNAGAKRRQSSIRSQKLPACCRQVWAWSGGMACFGAVPVPPHKDV